MKMIKTGITIIVAAIAARKEKSQNFTQHKIATSTKNKKSPSTVEKAQASSMKPFIRSCGDSANSFVECSLLAASIFGSR